MVAHLLRRHRLVEQRVVRDQLAVRLHGAVVGQVVLSQTFAKRA